MDNQNQFYVDMFAGDRIAQAKSEISQFKLLLKNTATPTKKAEITEVKFIPRDIVGPTYNFITFQKYMDEKLSSANSDIYLSDLDEIYHLANECLSNYYKLHDKKQPEVMKDFTKAMEEGKPLDVNKNYKFEKQAMFCYNIYQYYQKKESHSKNQ